MLEYIEYVISNNYIENKNNLDTINILNKCINNITSKNTYIVSSTATAQFLIFKPKKWYHFFKLILTL
jgi:hypothetical protein